MHVITILRDYLGITQTELARQAGITQADLSEMEKHPYGSIEKYKRLSAVLDIPIHTLVTNDLTTMPISFFDAHPHRPYRDLDNNKDKRTIIGRGGEEEALRIEQLRVDKIAPVLSHMVLPYYKFRSNSPGFDILSYDLLNNQVSPIFIEVKTTEKDADADFTITRKEFAAAKKAAARGIPYRFYRFSRWGHTDQSLQILDFATMLPLRQIYPSDFTCSMKPQAVAVNGIAYYRQLRGLTQTQLADQLGIFPHHLCLYEKGEQEAKAVTYQKIAEVLETTIDELLRSHDVPPYEQ